MHSARRLLCLAGLLAPALAPALAQADVILYQNDFESGVIDSHWGATARLDQASAFSKFMGRYSENTPQVLNNSVSLTIPSGPIDTGDGAPGGYVLKFDFYCIDSWDGNSTTLGPDLFEVYINTHNYFSYTFSNNANYGQSYPNAPTVGPALLGYNTLDRDSIYRDITIPFDPGTSPTITIKWRSNGLQGMADESWGIDNVSVSMVPSPGSMGLMAAGGLIAMRRRRR